MDHSARSLIRRCRYSSESRVLFKDPFWVTWRPDLYARLSPFSLSSSLFLFLFLFPFPFSLSLFFSFGTTLYWLDTHGVKTPDCFSVRWGPHMQYYIYTTSNLLLGIVIDRRSAYQFEWANLKHDGSNDEPRTIRGLRDSPKSQPRLGRPPAAANFPIVPPTSKRGVDGYTQTDRYRTPPSSSRCK